MTKFLLPSVLIFLSAGSYVMASDISKGEMAAYMEGCRKGLSQAKTTFDSKDIEMLCSDPYLKGKPNESAADKARRMRLINKTNEDKERVMSNWVKSKDDLKPCFDSVLANDPGKDLQDVKMLCTNPYLTPTANESENDHTRRLRLIKESEADKERMLDKFVVTPKAKKDEPNGVRQFGVEYSAAL